MKVITITPKMIKQHTRREAGDKKISMEALLLLGYIKTMLKEQRKIPKLKLPEAVAGTDFVRVSSKQIIKELGWDTFRQASYLKQLKAAGLIEIKRIGFPGPKRYINPNPVAKKQEVVK